MGFYIADELNKDGPALCPPFVGEVSPQGHHHDISERPPWHHWDITVTPLRHYRDTVVTSCAEPYKKTLIAV
mgnify:CR=1 FL=1